MESVCLSHAVYLLKRAMLTRGLNPTHEHVTFRTLIANHSVGHFGMSFLPGNRRIIVSHDSVIFSWAQNQGHGQRFLAMREEMAREAGANLLMATVRNDNEIENHLLTKHGWTRMLNRKTGVSLWAKEL
jgi:hypothetical protein